MEGAGCDQDPNEYLKGQRGNFTQIWAPPGLTTTASADFEQLRLTGKIKSHAIRFDQDMLVKAVKGYKKDSLGTYFFLLPNYAISLRQFGMICVQRCSTHLTNSFSNIKFYLTYALYWVSQGGVRAIAKTPMIYRMLCRSTNSVKEWEEEFMTDYETATKGSSALVAALVRNVVAEVAVALGLIAAGVFNDYINFFDTIDLPTLITEAIHSKFPGEWLTIAILQHTAPRVLQAFGFCADPIAVIRSILLGVDSV